MFKINILAIGKDKQVWVSDALNHYQKLLSRYASIELVALPHARVSRSQKRDEVLKQEAGIFAKRMSKGVSIALSDKGETMDSHQFASFLERLQGQSGAVSFLIGGPYGLDDTLCNNCDYRLSLSSLTFSHQLTRLVLLEQLYRGYSILAGTDYHK
jgi:23S rRNA (pseudouridine1915-N3)-methyltransferase